VFAGKGIRESDTGSFLVSNGSAPASGSWTAYLVGTSGPAIVGAVGSTGAVRVQTTSTISGNRAVDLRKQGESQPGWTVDFDGKLQWGPGGSTAPDTNLYRNSAGELKTDGKLTVGGDFAVTGIGSTKTAVKTGDQTKNASTTYTNDTELQIALPANSTWMLDGLLIYSSSATADAKVDLSVPASATYYLATNGLDPAGTTAAGSIDRGVVTNGDGGGGMSGRGVGTTTKNAAMIRATVIVAGTAGNLNIQWAQRTSDATNTVLFRGSWIRMTRIS